MRDQLLEALRTAGMDPPPAEDVTPTSDKLTAEAEIFYNETPVNFPAVKRDTPLDIGAVGRNYAWARILESLGIDDAMLVHARVNERDDLIAEFRRHDSLALMMKKIAFAAGIYNSEDVSRPFSTREALAAGIALQNIFSSLSHAAVSSVGVAAKATERSVVLEAKLNRAEELLREATGKLHTLDGAKPRAAIPTETSEEAPDGYFIVIGDIKADANADESTPIVKRGYITSVDPDSNTLRKYALLPELGSDARRFKSLDATKRFIEKMLVNKNKVRLNPNQVCSLRIVRPVYEMWRS